MRDGSSSPPPTPKSTSGHCVLKSAVLLLTASDSLLLKAQACWAYTTVWHPHTVNKTSHLFSHRWMLGSDRKSVIFTGTRRKKEELNARLLLIYVQSKMSCTISCPEWSPTSKATIRRKGFNSIFFWTGDLLELSSLCLCIPQWLFPWMIQRGKRKEGLCGKWNRESVCAYVCVFWQERPGGR